ncbi:MAG: hypothetical protein ABIO70_01765 [Pseudomonadota bacterium]
MMSHRAPFLLLAALLATSAQAAPPVDGETFAETAATTVNVMRLHLDFLEAQNDYDMASLYALADVRSAKADLLVGDGARLDGGVSHMLGGVGLGFGHPREGLAIFGGYHFDMLRAGGFPLGSEVGGFQAQRRDQLGYLGVGVLGTQASFGWRRVSALQGVDPDGVFEAAWEWEKDADDITMNSLEGGTAYNAQVITLYNRRGAGLGAMISPMLETGSYTTAEARKAVLAALHGEYEPRGMTGALGQAAAGFNRLHQGMDFYREGAVENGEKPMWEVPLTLRDVGELGLGVQVVPQITPKFSFRSAQAVWNVDVGQSLIGGRVVMTRRNGEADWSWDAYAQLMHVVFRDRLLTTGSLALGYSYNSPDCDSFLPFSHMHVFALQFNLGVPGIHPIAPPASGWRSAAFDDVDPYYEIYQTRGEEGPLGAEAAPPEEPLRPPSVMQRWAPSPVHQRVRPVPPA